MTPMFQDQQAFIEAGSSDLFEIIYTHQKMKNYDLHHTEVFFIASSINNFIFGGRNAIIDVLGDN